jgi:MoaA/NifB/PqqE/SkfB family radical SAM enzyme
MGWFVRKLLWQLDRACGLIRYPFQKRRLLKLLSSSLCGLRIETTNICNANCVFCAYQYQRRSRGVMSIDLFRKVIEEWLELGGGPVDLTPTVGDPLLDDPLLERLAFLRTQPGITSVGMFSNMIALDRVGAAALATSGITRLLASVSGFDEAMYRRVFRSPLYKQVLANIQAFVRANQAAGNPVDFRIEMRVDRPLRQVFRYPDYLMVARMVGQERINVNLRYVDWAGRIKTEQLPGTMRLRRWLPPRISPCSELYSGPMVYWDGRVGACGCMDLDASDLVIGDARVAHLGDMWFGEEIHRLRDSFLTDKVPPICRTCKGYNNLSHLLTNYARAYLSSIKPCQYRPQARLVGSYAGKDQECQPGT